MSHDNQTDDNAEETRIDRRDALKAMAVAAASVTLADSLAPDVAGAQQLRRANTSPAAAAAPPRTTTGPRGTPTDPDLLRGKVTWPMLLTAAELVTLTALCDVIIPADDKSPSASTVGVPAYINEYVSAPYDWAERTLVRVRGGLVWLDVESNRRFSKPFAMLTAAQQALICDDICFVPTAKPEFQFAARFFDSVRDLTASGFYTSDVGMKDIGHVGNVPLARFEGPPPHVLKHVGLP